MEKPFLLHMITSEKNTSPFDANMAFDAGWDSIIPYTDVDMDEIQALVQSNFECGLSIKNFDDLKVNDKLEAYEHVQVARKL